MRASVAFVVLFSAFAIAVLGAAVTTAKSIETKQAAKSRAILIRPAG